MAMATILGAASLATSLGSLLFSSSGGAKAAKKAAEEARRLRDWYESRARETSHKLNAELETMRTLRSLDMPAYQASAQIAHIQRQKGSERVGRQRMLGGLGRDVNDAIFGGQLNQYLGRENERLGRYAGLTKQIFDMASQSQQQVNQMLQAGGQQYVQMLGQANHLSYQAEVATGNRWGKALGALSQGLAMASQGYAQKEQLAEQRTYMEAQQAEMRELYGVDAGAAGNPQASAESKRYSRYFSQAAGAAGNPQASALPDSSRSFRSSSEIQMLPYGMPNMYGLDPRMFSQFMMGRSPAAFGLQQGY